jgi:O-antigen/teichoic acid export membrane protein
MIGLGNIVPQATSQASINGPASAWRAARVFLLLAALPLLAYTIAVLLAPALVLRIVYGSASDYTHLAVAVQLLVLAGLPGYVTEIIISFLHGISAAPRAFIINATGTLATVALVIPLIAVFGLTGACVVLMLANVSRLLHACVVLARITALEPPRSISPQLARPLA